MNVDQIRIVPEIPSMDSANSSNFDQSKQAIAIDGLNFVWRNLRFVMTTAILCSLATFLVLSLLPRYYVAVNTVVLERKESRPFEADEQLKSQDRDRSAAETEMDFITSRMVIGRVVDKLKLTEHPQFNGTQETVSENESGILGVIARSVSAVVKYVTMQFGSAEDPSPSPDKRAHLRDNAITTLVGQTSVTRGGESLAVRISVVNSRPKLAADLANAIAKEYVLASMDVKREYGEKAAQYLKERGVQPFLTSLRNEEAKLQQNRAELLTAYGSNHPQVLAIDARIDTVKSILGSEMQRITEDLSNEAERPSARVVSEAETPSKPTYPRTNVIVTSAFLGSGILAIVVLLVSEGLRNTVRSSEQVLRMIRLPNLAYVPALRKRRPHSHLNPLMEVVKHPQSEFSEAMRTLYLGCRATTSVRPRQAILITSCMPGEGKTSISIGLSATAAADDRKTVLVDLDLHNYKIYESIGMAAPQNSLNEFLVGECQLGSIVRVHPDLPGLNVIGIDARPFGPSSLLSSERLEQLMRGLRQEFDFIVFDTPPILSVDDANWLAPLVDATIITVAWDQTTEGELLESVANLRLNRAPLLGTVINRLNPLKQARYGLSGAAKYSKRARAAYGE